MKEKNNIVKYSLSKKRFFSIVLFYYIGFQFFIPMIASYIMIKLNPNVIEFSAKHQFFMYLAAFISCVILFFPILKKETKLEANKLIYTFILGIVVAVIINVAFTSFMEMFGNVNESNNQLALNNIVMDNKIFYLIMVIFLAPCVEEIVFRGTIFRGLRGKTNFFIAAIISSLLFGFIHVSISFFAGDFVDFIYIVLYSSLGLLFAIAYEYNHSIYACILFHMLYNLLGSISIIFS